MTSGATLYRSILIYGICLPLAMFLGYMLAMPLDLSSVGFFFLVIGVLVLPVVLRWHYPLMFIFWNTALVLPFLPGRPQAYIAFIGLSFLVAIVTRTMNKRMRFLTVPSVVASLVFLGIVILITAQMNGGIGLRILGGEVIGGKRYVFVFAAILGYFAITAQRIPPEKAGLYLGLFYLPGLSQAVASLIDYINPAFYWIFMVFPVERLPGGETSIARLAGISVAALCVYRYMLGRYGIRGIFLEGRPWRLAVFVGTIAVSLAGGYRSYLILAVMIFCIQFLLEGLLRTRLALALGLAAVLAGMIMLPHVDKLPRTIQRTVAFLPVNIDPEVRVNADASSQWRIEMWKTALPMVPQHLLLGTGYAIDPTALAFSLDIRHRFGADYQTALLCGDFHNGPLSLLIPFGIWGGIGFLWFLVASFGVLRRNYRYGDPSLKMVNTYLLAAFIAQTILFFFVFGALQSDLMTYAGLVGLSVALNGGVAKPSPAPEPEAAQSEEVRLAAIQPQARPVLGRR